MNRLRFIARVLVALCFVPLVWLLCLSEAAVEAHKKKKLGDAYEGPAED